MTPQLNDPREGLASKLDDFINLKPLVRSVPIYGLLYYAHIHSEYILFSSQISPDDKSKISDIDARAVNKSLTWHDIYTFELILLKHRNLQNLKNKVVSLREKYRSVVGQKNYEIYLASKPPDATVEDPPAGTPEADNQRQNLQKDCE